MAENIWKLVKSVLVSITPDLLGKTELAQTTRVLCTFLRKKTQILFFNVFYVYNFYMNWVIVSAAQILKQIKNMAIYTGHGR